MKLEKIKNYNQRILAILGTLAIVFVAMATIGVIGVTISELLRYNRYDHNIEIGIFSDEKVDELQKKNKREQVISYENPKLIDTINTIYIIPVSHKNLNDAEDINGLLNLTDSGFDSNESYDKRYSKGYYGVYNNLIIYNPKSEVIEKLFNSRVNFNDIKVEYFKDDILLLFEIAEKDTYKDGVINLQDFKSLYFYSVKNKKLKKIANDNMDLVSYEFLSKTKNLILHFGVDKDKNGKYESLNEPTIIKKYNYLTEELTDIIGKEMNSELQKILEGSVD